MEPKLHGAEGGDLPAPIPWLITAGRVSPLDAGERSRPAPAAPTLIQIRRSSTPEKAVNHLNGLEWYLYGGSYFDGIVGRRSGPMRWGP